MGTLILDTSPTTDHSLHLCQPICYTFVGTLFHNPEIQDGRQVRAVCAAPGSGSSTPRGGLCVSVCGGLGPNLYLPSGTDSLLPDQLNPQSPLPVSYSPLTLKLFIMHKM